MFRIFVFFLHIYARLLWVIKSLKRRNELTNTYNKSAMSLRKYCLQVTSEAACRLACDIESEFLCRSFLYLGAPHSAAYNCRLYHLDHHTLPDGPSAYLNAERPLIDDGEPIGKYSENFCESKCTFKMIPCDFYIMIVQNSNFKSCFLFVSR